ncbi:MAG: DUF192 domain-containing protein [Nanoarchaeota archaeon]
MQKILLLLLLLGCTSLPQLVIHFSNHDYLFKIEIVDTPALREKGLMNRSYLAEDQGMLFVFDREQVLTFWMKDTLIPLDILFIDQNERVVDIQTMGLCLEEPCPGYISRKPAQYALEINAGMAQRYGIQEGDSLILPR